MENKNIKIREQIADMLSTRQTIIELFNNISTYKENEIILDFKNVEFISRSASDQLYKEIQKSSKIIKLINTTENVDKMMKIVTKTQFGANRQLYKVPIMDFNKNNLNNFLQTI